jgi:RNA polymerase sigma-70 factor, ECF subfamily
MPPPYKRHEIGGRMTSIPGREIARRARLGGDEREALFRELWAEHWPRLASFLSAFGLGEEDGEESAQDALVKAFERILDYDPKRAFSTWLYAIGKNLARDRMRSERARSRAEARPRGGLDDAPEPASRYPGPEEEAVGEEEAAFARAFLAGLDACDRAIAELFYGQDLSCAEIARCAGAPPGTVKWRLSEIRRRLAAAWEAEHGRS